MIAGLSALHLPRHARPDAFAVVYYSHTAYSSYFSSK